MRKLKKSAVLLAIACTVIPMNVNAQDVYDADYSAALIAAMGQGMTPEETVLQGMEGTEIQEVAVDKVSYTTDVLTVRENPGIEYQEVAMLSKFSQIEVIGVCDNGWSHVILQDGTAGYVCNEYLSDVVPEGAENIGDSLGVFTITYSNFPH